MKPPRVTAGLGQGRGGLAHILPGKAASGAACFSLSPQTPQKPLEPLRYSETLSSTAKKSRGFAPAVLLDNPPGTSVYSYSPSPAHLGQRKNPAPSAENRRTPSPGGGRSSPGGFRGVPGSTPPPTRPRTWGTAGGRA